jgi:hypothetical protein
VHLVSAALTVAAMLIAAAMEASIAVAMVAMLSPKGFLGMVHGGSGEVPVAFA